MEKNLQPGKVYEVKTKETSYKGIYLLDVTQFGTLTRCTSSRNGEIGFKKNLLGRYGLKRLHVFLPLDNSGVEKLLTSNNIKSIDEMIQFLRNTLEKAKADSIGKSGSSISPFKTNLNTLDLVTHGVIMVDASKITDIKVTRQAGLNVVNPESLQRNYFVYLGSYSSALENWLNVPGIGSNSDMQKMLRQLILIYNTMPVVLRIEPQGIIESRYDKIQQWLKLQNWLKGY